MRKISISLLCLLIAIPFFVPQPVTAPQSGDFSFGFAGDFGGVDNPDTTLLLDDATNRGLSFFIGLGDLGYTPNEQAWCSYVKSHFDKFVVIAGNHDTSEDGGTSNGGYINELIPHCPFNLGVTVTNGPGTPGYGYEYRFDYPASNPFARFILIAPGVGGCDSAGNCFDYDFSASGSHYAWVRDSIDQKPANIKQVFVAMHKNCIDTGVKSCQIGTALNDMLAARQVFVLHGHDHLFQHTQRLKIGPGCSTIPVNNNPADPDCIQNERLPIFNQYGAFTVSGMFDITAGTGGNSHYSINQDDPEFPYFFTWDDSHYGYVMFKLWRNSNIASAQLVANINDVMLDIQHWDYATSTAFFLWDWADHNNDGVVDILDVAAGGDCYDATPQTRPECAYWDINVSYKIDIVDLAFLATYFDVDLRPSYFSSFAPPKSFDAQWLLYCNDMDSPVPRTYCSMLS